MLVTLNIGLLVGRPDDGRNGINSRDTRARWALARLGRFGLLLGSRREIVDHVGPDGRTLEDTLVVRMDPIDARVLSAVVYDLAVLLSQDCIAMRVDGQDGVLIGPRAAAWGAFNPDFFTEYDAAPVAAAA